jgi:hypothetical protein
MKCTEVGMQGGVVALGVDQAKASREVLNADACKPIDPACKSMASVIACALPLHLIVERRAREAPAV